MLSIPILIAILIILIWTCIYTVSYGIWTFKSKNILGGVMVFLLALTSMGLPVFLLFFR